MKSNQRKNVAFIDFEFDHHVLAIKKALKQCLSDGIHLNVKLWCSRVGIKPLVDKNFSDVYFVPHDEHKINKYQAFNLTETEIEHFSYTHSRTKILRDIHKIKSKDVLYYQRMTSYCYEQLKKNDINMIFFSDIPHTIEGLAFDYASKRLKCLVVYRDGPYFGNFNSPLQIDRIKNKTFKNGDEFSRVVIDELNKRNIKKKYQRPHYIANVNKKIIGIPKGLKPYFYLDIGKFIFSYTKSIFLAKSINFLIRKILSFFMQFYFSFCLNIFHNSSSVNKITIGDNYFLILLHYHPERTTSNCAYDTPFDIKRIEQLSLKFPDKKIIVYEHFLNLKEFRSYCYRPINFFSRMGKLKNVTYMLPKDNEFYRKLVTSALVTISTSGTHALESPQVGVPAIHFSNSFARMLPGVITLKNVKEVSLELINNEKEYLNKLCPDKYQESVLKVLNKRPFNEGFIAGYHDAQYDKSSYESDAQKIIFNHLKYCLQF